MISAVSVRQHKIQLLVMLRHISLRYKFSRVVAVDLNVIFREYVMNILLSYKQLACAHSRICF